MPEVPDTVDDAIEPLSSPSTDEVFEATRPFSAREIASAAASEALSGGGGGLTAPATIPAGTSGDTTLDVRAPDENAPALQLSNDVWDTDPTDPVFKFYANDDGSSFWGPGGTGHAFTLAVLGARVRIDCGSFQVRHANVAPADASLANGEFGLWLDQTNGAAKLKIKAKQADGTVVTGEVALSA